MHGYYVNTSFEFLRMALACIAAKKDDIEVQHYLYNSIRYFMLAILLEQGHSCSEYDSLEKMLRSCGSSKDCVVSIPQIVLIFMKALDDGQPVPIQLFITFLFGTLHITADKQEYTSKSRIYMSMYKHGGDVQLDTFAVQEYKVMEGDLC